MNSLFNNMTVGHMSVNLNMGGQNIPVNQMNPQFPIGNNQMLPNYNQPQHQIQPMLAYIPDEKESKVLLIGEKIKIGLNYKVSISKNYDKTRRPKDEYGTINDRYVISDIAGGQSVYLTEVGEIVNRKLQNPPILTILDVDDIEDKSIIDDMLFNTILLAHHYEHKSFFLILEESGTLEVGEPETTTFYNDRGLFRKTIYRITF